MRVALEEEKQKIKRKSVKQKAPKKHKKRIKLEDIPEDQLTKKQKKKLKRKVRRKKHRFLKFFLRFCFLNLFLVIMAVFIGFMYVRQRLDNMAVIDAQYLQTYDTSKITDKDGNVIWEPTDRRVTVLEYDEIPELYKQALIAVEDAEYWTSPGVSYKGIFNMVYTTIRSKVDSTVKPRGGSTLEQQLIKNVYYNGGYGHETTTRKIQEIFLALQIDRNFTKEEILSFYVNHLEFAEGATGLGQIMKTYFNKSPDDYKERTIENIAEMAYLAGLSKGPTIYNLYTNPEKARERTDTVLYVMWQSGLITEQEYGQAKTYDLTSNLQERGWEAALQVKQNRRWKIYTDGVLEELNELGYDLDKASMTVQTFLDPEMFDGIAEVARNSDFYLDADQQAAVAVIDHDGIVVSLVGSRYGDDEFNRATAKNRSSGSSMKPFTAYGPLLQYFGDSYDTTTPLDTSNYNYPGTDLYMHNYGGGIYGMQPLMRALRKSYNTPVARICDEVLGPSRMKAFLHGVGLDEKDYYSAVDGIGLYISPLQSAAAYNTLNNMGVYTEPRFIKSITFSDGSVKEIEPRRSRAMNESVAYVLNQILRGMFTSEGTAASYGVEGWDGYAGKSGSVKFAEGINAPDPYGQGGSDMWFCSYTNGGYAVSVWTGYDIPNTSPQMPSYYTGQKDICIAVQKYLNGEREIPDWEMPENVEVISGSGLMTDYRVTDSVDLGDTGIEWEQLDEDNFSITQVRPEYEIGEDWQDAEDPWWVEYYKENGNISPDVIDMETYSHLDE